MKVLVFRHEHTPVLNGQLPHDWIGRSAFAQETNVQRLGKELFERRHQLFRQLFVEEEAHDSGGRDTQCATFALSGVGQARPDVFSSELREFRQDLIFRHPARQVPEDVTDRDASAPDAGLAESHIRRDRDALQATHTPSVRQPSR